MPIRYFPLSLDVEESQLGPVLRILNGLPGVEIHLDLDKAPGAPKPAAKLGNGHDPSPRPGGPTSKDIVVAFLLEHGPSHLRDLVTHLSGVGFQGASAANYTLNQLRKNGVTESGGSGIHRLTKKAEQELRRMKQKALPAPEASKPAKPPSDKKTPVPGANHLVLKTVAAAEGPIGRLDLSKVLVEAGLSGGSIDGALFRLKNKGLIKSSGAGLVEITPKGKTEAQKEEVTHG